MKEQGKPTATHLEGFGCLYGYVQSEEAVPSRPPVRLDAEVLLAEISNNKESRLFGGYRSYATGHPAQ